MHQYFVFVFFFFFFVGCIFLFSFVSLFHRGHFLLRRVSSFLYLFGGSSFFNHVRFACLPMSLYGSLLVFHWQAIFLLLTISPFSHIFSLIFVCYGIVLGCLSLQCTPIHSCTYGLCILVNVTQVVPAVVFDSISVEVTVPFYI